jgi:hypothetical protein
LKTLSLLAKTLEIMQIANSGFQVKVVVRKRVKRMIIQAMKLKINLGVQIMTEKKVLKRT